MDKVLKFVQQAKGFDKLLQPIKFKSAINGSIAAELKIADEHLNFMDSLHGGFSATLVDVISSMGLLTHEKGYVPSVSVNMNISYIGAAKKGDTIEILAQTLKVGKSLAYLQVEIKNKETGALLVKGSHTKFLMQPR